MAKITDYERELSVALSFPAEYKFTRGSWNSEAIINKLSGQSNFILSEQSNEIKYYKIQSWSDEVTKFATYNEFSIINLKSTILNQDRKLYISLPENYSNKRKYPVVYITDAQNINNFDIANQTLKQQAKFNIFPNCILVGIYQNERNNELDRKYGEKGKKFKDFIFKEVISYVNATYATADYKAIIGHSDGAEYNHYLMFETDNPFDAYINISEDIKLSNYDKTKEVVALFKDFITNNKKEIHYFVASGKYDFWHRYEAGQQIDSIFNQQQNTAIKFKHKLYLAEHNELVAKSILDGLSFIFADFRNFQDLDKDLETPSFNYLQSKQVLLDKTRKFQPDYEITEEDFAIIDDLISSKKRYSFYKQYLEVENINYETIPRLSIARQYYFLGEYEKSLALFQEILDINDQDSFAYFQTNFTPILDIYVKIYKNPKAAIQYLKDCLLKMPENKLIFSYYIAKTGLENKVDLKLAKASLYYCEQNYIDNNMFSLEDVALVKQKIQ